MWTRADLKENAKSALRTTYWPAFWVTILVGLLTINVSSIYNFTNLYDGITGHDLLHEKWFIESYLLLGLFNFFISSVILVGLCRFFVRNHYGETKLRNLFFGFGRDYGNIFAVLLVTRIIVWLWSLLFLIPGIIANYSYCMVPYLLSENPNMDGKQARRLSIQMTEGQKWNIFVLELSFLGWYLLGLICLLVGVLLIPPYEYSTKAELYIFLRDRNGLVLTTDRQEGGASDVPVEP